jgi:hypothetical protein
MMNTNPCGPGGDEPLTPVVENITRDFSQCFRRRPSLFWWLFAAVLLLILSPLFALWFDLSERKEWSEIVKNVVESLAVVAGAFAIVQWVSGRRDRATDVLLRLEEEFKKQDVMGGRKMVEDTDYDKQERSDSLDALLRFYVVLHGVSRASQVPEESLSICFRYWLAHYFRGDRPGFRGYVDRSYPTLSRWLRDDCRQGLPFFRPHRLFGEHTDEKFIQQCRQGAIP